MLVETGEAVDRGDLPVRSYECPFCGTWHWTSDPNAFESLYKGPTRKVSDKKERRYKKPTGQRRRPAAEWRPPTPEDQLPEALRHPPG